MDFTTFSMTSLAVLEHVRDKKSADWVGGNLKAGWNLSTDMVGYMSFSR